MSVQIVPIATGVAEGTAGGIDPMRRIGFDRIIDTDRPIRGTCTLSPSSSKGEGRGEDEGWSQGGAGANEGAIRICQHPAIPVRSDIPPIWSRVGDALHFAAPGVAEYRCTSTRIDVTPITGATQDMIEALLIATALPAVLWLQGDLMLHAAAVIPHGGTDGALAIAGASGSGKSRLAAAFMANGACLVADDSIAVRQIGHDDASLPGCAGLAGGYHLRIAGGQGERTFHPVADYRARRAARLAAVVVLDAGSRTGRTRLGTVDAIETLLANRHRPSVPRLCGLEARLLRDAARLARAVPIYRWPRDDADALLDDAIRRKILQPATRKGKR